MLIIYVINNKFIKVAKPKLFLVKYSEGDDSMWTVIDKKTSHRHKNEPYAVLLGAYH